MEAGSMKIHWMRVLGLAVLYEVVLIAMTVAVTLFIPLESVLSLVPIVVFVVGFPFGMWVARNLRSGFVLHGMLLGVAATVLYFGLILGTSGSIAPVVEMYGAVLFFLANALKILGCVAGAYAAGRRRVPAHA
jgi:hypothetical protein